MKATCFFITTIALAIFILPTLNAQDLKEVESRRQHRKSLRALDKLEADAASLAQSKVEMTTDACFAAVGHKNFCKCLGENLPMMVFFQTYTRIVSMTKSEIIEASSEQDKTELQHLSKLIDKTRDVRDKCVKENFQ